MRADRLSWEYFRFSDADIGSMESELGIHLVEVTSNSEGLLRAVYHAQRAGFPILSTLC